MRSSSTLRTVLPVLEFIAIFISAFLFFHFRECVLHLFTSFSGRGEDEDEVTDTEYVTLAKYSVSEYSAKLLRYALHISGVYYRRKLTSADAPVRSNIPFLWDRKIPSEDFCDDIFITNSFD